MKEFYHLPKNEQTNQNLAIERRRARYKDRKKSDEEIYFTRNHFGPLQKNLTSLINHREIECTYSTAGCLNYIQCKYFGILIGGDKASQLDSENHI